jgi:hypothetical protein
MSINSVNGNTLLESGAFAPCRVATTGPLTLSGLQTVDGIALIDGDRVLVWQQADETTNGIYAASSGTWVRTTDAASNTQFFDGMAVVVARGTQAGQIFLCTSTDDPVIVGTSLLTFELQQEVLAESQSATSTTAATVGTGSKTFATQSGKDFSVNQWVLIYDAVAVMLGQITAYAAGSLTVSVVSTSGSGTHADWTIALNNSLAAAGLSPPVGSGNVTGPGTSIAGHAAVFADATGKLLSDSGVPLSTLAGRSQLLYGDAGAASIPESALVPGSAPLPRAGVQPNDNLSLVNDGTNPTRDGRVTAGRCRDDSDVMNLHLLGTMVKRLDQAWASGGAAGSPVGGCDTGTKGANQTWHVFLIAKPALAVTSFSRTSNVATLSVAGHGGGVGGTVRTYGLGQSVDALAVITGVTTNTISFASTGADIGVTNVTAFADLFDVLLSQSYAAPTLPSGWTAKQSLGSFLTDGSNNVRPISQFADEFWFKTPPQDITFLTGSSLVSTQALTVPNGLSVQAILNIDLIGQSGGAAAYFSNPSATDMAPQFGGGGAPLSSAAMNAFVVNQEVAAQIRIWTDAARSVHVRPTDASTVIYAVTLGYRDPRRRLF